jgi:hypothetical protein
MLRAGLSRMEVLVLLALVLVLSGLITIAVVRVRESADRMRCQNNLKQLTLAWHNYCDCNPRLPPLVDQGEGTPTGQGLPSVFFTLTLYIEAGPMLYRPGKSPPKAYHAHSSVQFPFHHKDGTTGTSYGGAANQLWHVFIDPADTTADKLRDIEMLLPDGTTGYYATGSYAANGLLPWGTKSFRESFPRGTEITILFAERPQVCRTATGDTIYNLWGVGFYSPHMPAFATLSPADPPELWSTEQVAPVLPLPEEDATERIQVRIGRRDANPQQPDFATPVQMLRNNLWCDPRLPGTPHRAGMQVAMADGSVRVFAPDTTPWVFWSACSAN